MIKKIISESVIGSGFPSLVVREGLGVSYFTPVAV